MTAGLARDGAAFLGALAVTAAITPVARRTALRLGILDRPGPNKFHRQPSPYLGGVAIVASVLAAAIASLWAQPEVRGELLAIAIGGVAVAGVGLIDDVRVLPAAPRLTVQAVAAVGLWSSGIRITASGIGPVDLALTVLAVLSITNAVNLVDNMDGLAAGTVAIASLYFLGIAVWQGQELVALMAAALAGASLGFLPFNFPPARIFLGDAGALFLGFLLAALALKIELAGYGFVTGSSVVVLILAVPLFDMVLVLVSRWLGGRPLFRGGTDHSSHRLMARLGSERTVAVTIYAAGILCGAVGAVLLVVHRPAATWVAVTAATLTAAAAMAFLERRFAAPGRPAMEFPHPGPSPTYTPQLIGRP